MKKNQDENRTETARLAVPMSQDQLRKLKAVAAVEGKPAGEWAREKLENAVREGLGGLQALLAASPNSAKEDDS